MITAYNKKMFDILPPDIIYIIFKNTNNLVFLCKNLDYLIKDIIIKDITNIKYSLQKYPNLTKINLQVNAFSVIII